jgi:hypothetical protein
MRPTGGRGGRYFGYGPLAGASRRVEPTPRRGRDDFDDARQVAARVSRELYHESSVAPPEPVMAAGVCGTRSLTFTRQSVTEAVPDIADGWPGSGSGSATRAVAPVPGDRQHPDRRTRGPQAVHTRGRPMNMDSTTDSGCALRTTTRASVPRGESLASVVVVEPGCGEGPQHAWRLA